MAIFQKSIVKKHISSINQELLKEKWNLFTSYFHNATIQENIHNSKEEQFQEGFLRELFVKVLGYTLNPEPNFNLTTEYKNIKDSKKADGAIIINDIVTAVIELKGTGTTDLGKVESQAFNYKNNQHQCVYVITSNFEKLRFYIDNAIEHIEFNLFKLTEEEFQLLYLCLAFKNIENNVPKNIKDESVSQEDVITKKLYNDYSLFKRELHHNLVALNPGNDPLELFQKSQKLLDRFLFIFFAEDRGLLPTNLIFRINKEWQQLREMRIEVSLYDRYKIYFSDLNLGAKVSLPAFSQTASNKKDEFQIYAYNGGLFKEDEELNTLKIDDALLFKHTEKLSNYDFASEVDVNILGHIFENSLNELDEIKAQIEGQEIDKTKTKRKKDGVFYTPKYITKYIVDNTVGKLCIDKKAEFKIIEEDYITDKKRNKTTIQNLATKLTDYRNWLLQITICDPACGSGAFLNQALDFLINEHKYIDELQAKLFGDALILSDVEQSILEHNIFGVDINEESVEIAKLSLWLRTAQPNRKLNDLNSNIKCGNSLIDDVAVAGDKAFNWFAEFPQVFPRYKGDKNYTLVKDRIIKSKISDGDELGKYKDDGYGLHNEFHEPPAPYSYKQDSKGFENGGFDVIIGNPPYVQIQSLKEISDILHSYGYATFEKTGDLYCLFYELGNKLLKNNGTLGFITSNKWMRANYGKSLRKYLLKYTKPYLLIDLGADVFESATVDSNILLFSKVKLIESLPFYAISLLNEKNISDFLLFENNKILINPKEDDSWIISNEIETSINKKLSKYGKPLKNWDIKINYGIKTGYNDAFIIDNKTKEKILDEDAECSKILSPLLRGRDIQRYNANYADLWLINTHNGYGNSPRIEIENFPSVKKHLDQHWVQIKKRYDQGYTPYNLRNCAYTGDFLKEKIIYPNMTAFLPFIYDNCGYFINDKAYILSTTNTSLKFLLVYLNSKIAWKWIKENCPELQGGTRELRKSFFENIPIINIASTEQLPFILLAEQMLILNKAYQELINKFKRSLQRKFELEDLPKKLQEWYLHSYPDFIKELAKKKIKLSLAEEAEWEEYFNLEAKKALELKSKIDVTDKEIDQMVYKLYDLTEEEIAIVEKS